MFFAKRYNKFFFRVLSSTTGNSLYVPQLFDFIGWLGIIFFKDLLMSNTNIIYEVERIRCIWFGLPRHRC